MPISKLHSILALANLLAYNNSWSCYYELDYIPISKLHSILSMAILLVHNNMTIIYYGQVNLLQLKSSVASKWASNNFGSTYASPSSGEAYRDRRLTNNFELWVEIFCVPTCFHMRIPKPCLSVCLSVCPLPEKRNHHSFVNISPTLVIDTSMERSSRVLHHGNPKIWFFFFKKVRNSNFDFWRTAEITLVSSISVLH